MPVKKNGHQRIFCLRCSYSLEGLYSNQCPECGLSFNLNDSNTYKRRPRLHFLRRWVARFSFSLVLFIMLLGITLLAAQFAYPHYVERRFTKVVESLESKYEITIEKSRCLGKQSDKILILAIFSSWNSDSYPFHITGDKAESYMSSSYWHGLWFNYSKTLKLDGERAIAYWSIRENRWHVGEFHFGAYNLVWQCICETCPPNSKSTVLSSIATR